MQKKYEDIVSEFRKMMGFSEKPLYDYKEPDEYLMYYEGYSKYAKKFNLRENDILAILKVVTESAAYQRSSQKSMMATKSTTIIPPENTEQLKNIFKDSEALIQTRQTHEREVADIAKIISNGLGLNKDFAYLIGLLHDIGHTWNGHTGERILSAIGRLNNCGYVVHNAMGAYILEREKIIERAIEEVKQFNPKASDKEIKEFMRYVIDGVVSHNGEGVVGKIVPYQKDTAKMEEEIKKCFTEKGFDKSIMPATMEGAVIRYADIIAYTRSDILDGFRLKDVNGNKIITEFDDEYLSIIGTALARKENFTKLLTLENKFLLEMYGLSKRIYELKDSKDPNDILEVQRTKKEREMIEYTYKQFEKYKIQYAKDYIKRIKDPSEVKTKVTQMMQNVFIMDLVEESKDKGYITMSPLLRRTLFSLRDLNVRRIVPYTRRIFETEELPIASKGLIDLFADVLVETGIAYELLDEDIKREVRPANTREMQEEKMRQLDVNPRANYERKICHYYQKQNPEQIKYIYENVLEAMIDITKHDIAIALGEEKYEGELKELYESRKINPIKRKIGEMGKTSEMMTDGDRERLFQEVFEERKADIERAVASKMAIEYVGGMTDNTILAALIEKNLISRQQLIEGYGRAQPGKQAADLGVQKLQTIFANNEAMIFPDDKKDDEISL